MTDLLNKTIAKQIITVYAELIDYLSHHYEKLTLPKNNFKEDWERILHHTDKRFQHPAWEKNINLSFIKQSYFYIAQQLKRCTNDLVEEEHLKKKLNYIVRQYLDGLAPSNFPHLNPAVMDEIVSSNGLSLLNGLQALQNDLKDGKNLFAPSLSERTAFTVGKNVACTEGKVIYENEVMQLIFYTPITAKVHTKPILFIPPWINKFYILDLQQHNSLVKWLLSQQFSVFMISWVNPNKTHADLSFKDYLQKGVIQAIKKIRLLSSHKLNVAGYCAGGTLLACTLAYLAQKQLDYVNSASFFTTLFDFSEPGELGVFIDEAQISALEMEMETHGFLSGKYLAAVFSSLRANDLIWTTFINRYLRDAKNKPLDLLYWNDDNTNVAKKFHSFYLREFYLNNKLIQSNQLKIAGVPIDLGKINVPSYFLATREDHLIPWQSNYNSHNLLHCQKRFVLTDSGHVAGVINPPCAQKYGYWINKKRPASADKFLEQAKYHAGSWWLDWSKWLHQHAGELQSNDTIKIKNFIEDAPGRYVKTRIDE